MDENVEHAGPLDLWISNEGEIVYEKKQKITIQNS